MSKAVHDSKPIAAWAGMGREVNAKGILVLSWGVRKGSIIHNAVEQHTFSAGI